LSIVTLVLLLASPIRAAEINGTPIAGGPALIVVNGEIEDGDAQKLIGAALRFDKAIVGLIGLKSPGGSLAEGIEMGTYIHAHGLATLVPNDV
jgi:hypothetical protein